MTPVAAGAPAKLWGMRIALMMVLAGVVPAGLSGCGSAGAGQARASKPAAATAARAVTPAPPPPPPARIVTRRRVMTFVDRRRSALAPGGGTEPRRLRTVVRYPQVVGGTAAERARRFPLVVFGHGYDLAPRDYRSLLSAWSRAGMVVAAPAFPGERSDRPGGPDRSDLVKEPGDLAFVAGRLLRASRRTGGPLAGRIDASRLAVAGHSDGGNAALAAAYDARFRTRRFGAAVILAGADLPGVTPLAFTEGGPPLLAAQGTADTINPPADTAAYFSRAHRPKFRLDLLGAGHYDPYMRRSPQLRVVERVSIAFLRGALGPGGADAPRLRRLGRRSGVSVLRART